MLLRHSTGLFLTRDQPVVKASTYTGQHKHKHTCLERDSKNYTGTSKFPFRVLESTTIPLNSTIYNKMAATKLPLQEGRRTGTTLAPPERDQLCDYGGRASAWIAGIPSTM
jgi:hypothetical protein